MHRALSLLPRNKKEWLVTSSKPVFLCAVKMAALAALIVESVKLRLRAKRREFDRNIATCIGLASKKESLFC